MKDNLRFKHARLQKGQSLVELALTLMVILMLIAGAFDLGSAFYYYAALRDAAQEGAIYGSVCEVPTEDPRIKLKCPTLEIINRIKISSISPIDFVDDINFEEPKITIIGEACTGGAINVVLVYNYQIVMPLLGTILGQQTIPITAKVTNTVLLPKCDE